jgi:hypothetical protein
MKSNLIHSPTTLAASAPGAQSRVCRIATRLLERLTSWRRPAIDARQVELLAETVAAQPALRQWLLVVASESPRVRRALLARAAQAMRVDVGNLEASQVLEQLADTRLMRAVTEYLLQQAGLQPLGRAKPKRPEARVRLDSLNDRLQCRQQQLISA